MPQTAPVTMLVTYRPKPGKEADLQKPLEQHGAALRSTGLSTKEPVRVWRAQDKRGHGAPQPYFVEMFQWRDGEASTIAHQTPEVMAVWEPMGLVLDKLELAVVEPIAAAGAQA